MAAKLTFPRIHYVVKPKTVPSRPPKPSCRACHGTGIVGDLYLPYADARGRREPMRAKDMEQNWVTLLCACTLDLDNIQPGEEVAEKAAG